MSVMDELTNVVNAAHNLLGTVSGKMQQIDRKVDQATQAVPETIRSMSTQTICVDAVEGDDNNDGSGKKPVKTALEAQSRHTSGSHTTIKLKEGQTHEITGMHPSLSTGIVEFSRWGNTNGISKPVAKSTTSYSENYDANRGRYTAIKYGSIIFKDVDIESIDIDNGKSHNNLDGFIYTYQCDVSLFIQGVNIRLIDRPLVGLSEGGRSGLRIFLENTDIEIISNRHNSSKIIHGGNAVYTLGVGEVTMPADVTWSDLITVNADASNIHTNLDTTSL